MTEGNVIYFSLFLTFLSKNFLSKAKTQGRFEHMKKLAVGEENPVKKFFHFNRVGQKIFKTHFTKG